MLTCVTLCAIFALTPCSALSTVIPSVNSLSDGDSNVGTNVKPDIVAILNLQNEATDDENDIEDPNESPYNLPQITIWTFPTERRAFIGDIEIFINSKEDAEYSHEAIDPQNVFVQHPHKHRLHKDLSDEEELPGFKVKIKRNEDEVILSEFQQSINDGPDEIVNYLSKLSTNARDKRGTVLIDHKEIVPGPPMVRHRRQWGISEYLQWLLPDFRETPANEPSTPKSNNDNQNKQMFDINREISGIHEELLDGIKNNVKDTQDKLKEFSEIGLMLSPVNPDLLKDLKEQLKDERRKRTIESESNMNLLVSKSDEDDDEESDELYDDLFKILQSDRDLYSVLIKVYYVGK